MSRTLKIIRDSTSIVASIGLLLGTRHRKWVSKICELNADIEIALIDQLLCVVSL